MCLDTQYSLDLDRIRTEDIKLVIVVRTDLDMGKGKIAAQVGHACVYATISTYDSDTFIAWLALGQKKTVLKISGEAALLNLVEMANSIGVGYFAVHDHGLTQVPASSLTCIAFGPASDAKLRQITGDLKLL